MFQIKPHKHFLGKELSPLAWGCSHPNCRHTETAYVVPTRVGMFLGITAPGGRLVCCPHSRGDVPPHSAVFRYVNQLSPLAWGCSHPNCRHTETAYVVPTRVGMFLGITAPGGRLVCCPHSRGDVPPHSAVFRYVNQLSPLAWGCSLAHVPLKITRIVVPTRVGMFPHRPHHPQPREGCPHSRGDVPEATRPKRARSALSPLSRGDVPSDTPP